jgi:hypothetical protein
LRDEDLAKPTLEHVHEGHIIMQIDGYIEFIGRRDFAS